MRNEAMEPLDVLVGPWPTTMRNAWFLEPADREVAGSATVEWLGDAFVVSMSEGPPGQLGAANGALAGLKVIDTVIGTLGWPAPGSEPEDAVHSIQCWLDQIVEIPHLVRVAHFRCTKLDENREALPPRTQASSLYRLADGGLPSSFSGPRVACGSADHVHDDERLEPHGRS